MVSRGIRYQGSPGEGGEMAEETTDFDRNKGEQREKLIALRSRILSSAPSPELDALIWTFIGGGLEDVVELSRTVVDHVDGEEDRIVRSKVLAGWDQKSEPIADEAQIEATPTPIWDSICMIPR